MLLEFHDHSPLLYIISIQEISLYHLYVSEKAGYSQIITHEVTKLSKERFESK